MNQSDLKWNINVFYWYRFLSRFYLYLPILAIILYNYKLTYIQIGLILATHGLAILIFKAPLGRLSERIPSGKNIIFMGEIIKALGVFSLAVSEGNIYWLIFAQVISGIGFALTSSTESGLLLKTLKAENDLDNYRKIEAKSQGFGFISILISGIIGSVVAKIDNSLALYLTVPFTVLAAIGILFFP